MDRHSLQKVLDNYTTEYADENAFIPRFLELLKNPLCFLRSNLDAHITGSAWIVSYDFSHILLIHHRKLGKWLQPGGHADGEENVLKVSLKEAAEETGLIDFEEVSENIFDIDIHAIPARKGVPAHFHYDIRFLLRAKKDALALKNQESHEIRWIKLEEINLYTQENTSINRMVEKTLKFCLPQ